MDGCISGSAPIISFLGLQPPINDYYYAATETFDASTAGGSTDFCKQNIKASWPIISELSQTIIGRQQLQESMKFCNPFVNQNEAEQIPGWVANAISWMAMGSYPYPSSYMLYGAGYLPAYPLRLGCDFLNHNFQNDSLTMLTSLSQLAGVFYNYSNTTKCFKLESLSESNSKSNILFNLGTGSSDWVGLAWGYLYCTEIFMPSGHIGGQNDMFWYSPWNQTSEMQNCQELYNIQTRPNWASINYGGRLLENSGVSNIVFSNGILDPWNGAGVHFNNSLNNIFGLSTGYVGHHMDLMFSTSMDTEQVLNVRQFELQQIQKWIDSH